MVNLIYTQCSYLQSKIKKIHDEFKNFDKSKEFCYSILVTIFCLINPMCNDENIVKKTILWDQEKQCFVKFKLF